MKWERFKMRPTTGIILITSMLIYVTVNVLLSSLLVNLRSINASGLQRKLSTAYAATIKTKNYDRGVEILSELIANNERLKVGDLRIPSGRSRESLQKAQPLISTIQDEQLDDENRIEKCEKIVSHMDTATSELTVTSEGYISLIRWLTPVVIFVCGVGTYAMIPIGDGEFVLAKQLLRELGDIMVVIDHDQKIVTASDAACRTFGVTINRIKGTHIREYVPDEYHENIESFLRSAEQELITNVEYKGEGFNLRVRKLSNGNRKLIAASARKLV
ncbi:PAS domain-containing protein [bacterium]|nr:PAS domain-containing protein [bacterium]